MSDQLDKYELHISDDILFIYNFIVKMLPVYPRNLVFKRNLRNLNESHSQNTHMKGNVILTRTLIHHCRFEI